MATLWDKGGKFEEKAEKFTVGKDRELDLKLAKYDIIGSKAHIAMLEKIGLLTSKEHSKLSDALDKILFEVEKGKFCLEEGVEDIHSQVELILTERLGDIGTKIHSGRSRNDQVAVDLKLFFKDECLKIRDEILHLFKILVKQSRKHKDVLMPGYTHFQTAMPSSFGLWLGAYAESLADDMVMLGAAYKIADQNPLGSAAGYGNSFPLDRKLTTKLLGFSTLSFNSIAAQMGRGKTERAIAAAIGQIAGTLNKLAQDCCLFSCPNFSFISFPDSLTTGSSIMPHKKNPDVWEMIRGNCNLISSCYGQTAMLTTNLPHGYHRDFQLLKEIIMPALEKTHDCLQMAAIMIENIKVSKDIFNNPLYAPIFTVEEVNQKVLAGKPFRQAYKEVAKEVAEKKFEFPESRMNVKSLNHTHIGSIGDLALKEIEKKMRHSIFRRPHQP
ncbi:MAG: argininosuccinate lyase [Bacteroidales bacterium]|nr:argininosuccinate lyase [Bacteroidales bacterium]